MQKGETKTGAQGKCGDWRITREMGRRGYEKNSQRVNYELAEYVKRNGESHRSARVACALSRHAYRAVATISEITNVMEPVHQAKHEWNNDRKSFLRSIPGVQMRGA